MPPWLDMMRFLCFYYLNISYFYGVYDKLAFALRKTFYFSNHAPGTTVVLLGDSLMDYPFQDFFLIQKIHNHITTSNGNTLYYVDAGSPGNRIADIKSRIYSVMDENFINENDYVILYWDSDCSDVDENSLSDEEVQSLRAQYQQNVNDSICMILEYTPYLAVAGPNLLGEGPKSDPSSTCQRWYDKIDMLNDYREINRNITLAYNLTYIDIRQASLDNIPDDWNHCSGKLTFDGEHPNPDGANLEASLFAKVIDQWNLERNPS